MNIENVKKAIAICQRAQAAHHPFNMQAWQKTRFKESSSKGPSIELPKCQTETELYECGTPACFAGLVAVSPEFRADGGVAYKISGAPRIQASCSLYGEKEYPPYDLTGSRAIAYWFDISLPEARLLCTDDVFHRHPSDPVWRVYHHTLTAGEIKNITIDHVIEALTRLRDTVSIFHTFPEEPETE